MFCDKCGAENPDDSTFCEKCGESLTDAPAPKSKSGAKSKSKAKPKRSAASSKAESTSTSTSNMGGFVEMLDKLPVALILLIAGAVCLAFALLSGLLTAIGADDIFDNGSYAAGQFFDRMVFGILVAGVLMGLSALISKNQ